MSLLYRASEYEADACAQRVAQECCAARVSLLGYHIRLWLAVDELVQHITELQAQPEVAAEHHAIPRAGVEYPAARDTFRPERRGVTYIAEEEKVAMLDDGAVADDAEERKIFVDGVSLQVYSSCHTGGDGRSEVVQCGQPEGKSHHAVPRSAVVERCAALLLAQPHAVTQVYLGMELVQRRRLLVGNKKAHDK